MHGELPSTNQNMDTEQNRLVPVDYLNTENINRNESFKDHYYSSMNCSSLNLTKDRSKTSFDGFSLRFEDLIVWIPKHKVWGNEKPEKEILKGITVGIPKGNMTAIIGPSGCGKTTMMNFLAGRQTESQTFLSYCNYMINGSKINNVNKFKNIIGYVLQDDIMDVTLTPRQLFTFYVKLRGIRDVKKKVDDVIILMCLERCADTIVGDAFRRGISGGEKKRTSIAIELISDPNLLFLDEPTTGLDSTTALDVMMNLADLKSRGITIISTIHSPSKEILDLFDQVIILVEGKLVYDGSPNRLEHRLERLQLGVPDYVEPIEHIMKIIDKDDLLIEFEKDGRDKGPNNQIVNEEYNKRIEMLVRAQAKKTIAKAKQRKVEESKIEELIKLSKKRNRKLNVFSQFMILLFNSSYTFYKDIFGVISKSLVFWILSLVLILIYLNLGTIEEETINSIQNRAGYVFILSLIYFFIGTNLSSTMFIPRKQIYLKDKQSRMYDDGPFFLANQVYSLPFFFVNITASLLVMFYAIKLNDDEPTNFLWYWLFGFCGSFLGGYSYGMILGVLADRIEDLGALIPIIVLPQLVVVGYFASVESMTWPLYIFSFSSPVRYSFQGFILTEFNNSARYTSSCKMVIDDPNGNEIIVPVPDNQIARCDPFKAYDFQQDTRWLNIVIALSINLGVRILAYFLFKFRYRERDARIKVDKAKVEKYSLKLDSTKQSEDHKEDVQNLKNLNTANQEQKNDEIQDKDKKNEPVDAINSDN